jgi:hypothetical protein
VVGPASRLFQLAESEGIWDPSISGIQPELLARQPGVRWALGYYPGGNVLLLNADRGSLGSDRDRARFPGGPNVYGTDPRYLSTLLLLHGELRKLVRSVPTDGCVFAGQPLDADQVDAVLTVSGPAPDHAGTAPMRITQASGITPTGTLREARRIIAAAIAAYRRNGKIDPDDPAIREAQQKYGAGARARGAQPASPECLRGWDQSAEFLNRSAVPSGVPLYFTKNWGPPFNRFRGETCADSYILAYQCGMALLQSVRSGVMPRDEQLLRDFAALPATTVRYRQQHHSFKGGVPKPREVADEQGGTMSMETETYLPTLMGLGRFFLSRIRPVHAYNKAYAMALYAPAIWFLNGLHRRVPRVYHPRRPSDLEKLANENPYPVILDLKNQDWNRASYASLAYARAVGGKVGGAGVELFERAGYPTLYAGPAYRKGRATVRGQVDPLQLLLRASAGLPSGTPTVSPEVKHSGTSFDFDVLLLLDLVDTWSEYEEFLTGRQSPGSLARMGAGDRLILGDNVGTFSKLRRVAEAIKAFIELDLHYMFPANLTHKLSGRVCTGTEGNFVRASGRYSPAELQAPGVIRFISDVASLWLHEAWDERSRENSEGWFSIRQAYADHDAVDAVIELLEQCTVPFFSKVLSACLSSFNKKWIRSDLAPFLSRHEDAYRWAIPIDTLTREEQLALKVVTMPAEMTLLYQPGLLEDVWDLDPAQGRAEALQLRRDIVAEAATRGVI